MDATPTENQASYSPPPILIVDQNSEIHTTLPHFFRGSPLITFDSCSSRQQAEQKLKARQYQAVVSDIRLAATDDFFLLDLNQQTQGASSFVVTAGPHDVQLILKALDRGSLDFLAIPLDSKQASTTIERAVWIHQMRTTIRRREEMLSVIRKQRDRLNLANAHEEKLAALYDQRLMDFEKTLRSCEHTIALVEKSLGYLIQTESSLKYRAQMRARMRLGAMTT